MLVRLILSFALIVAAAHAAAFDSWEHRRLSDLAYHIAINIHCPNNSDDESCVDLRPESKLDLTRKGGLSMWCRDNGRKSACMKYEHLFAAPPLQQYLSSRLAKHCSGAGKNEPACLEMSAILSHPDPAEPVDYAAQKGLAMWCVNNAKDKELCGEISRRARSAADNMRGIVAACLKKMEGLNCDFIYKLAPAERLAWASFFDPLARADEGAAYGNDSDLSYGQLVKCVDYFLTTEKLMAGSESRLWMKTADAQISAGSQVRAAKLYPSRREDLELSFNKRCDESYWNLEGARAGHVNHTHFQAELLLAQNSNHLLALTLHAEEKNRFAALAANGISDHYLQDSMAPGHITTWRSRLTDLAANAFHDDRNRKGLHVRVDKELFEKMMRPAADGGRTLDADILRMAAVDDDGVSAARVREYFLFPDKNKEKDCLVDRCAREPRNVESEIRLMTKLVAELRGKLQSRKTQDPVLGGCRDALRSKCVFLRGDGALWNRNQDEQRMLMLLLQVRSILDVLQSAPTELDNGNRFTLTNSFKETSWAWNATEAEPRYVSFLSYTYPPKTQLIAGIGPVEYEINQTNGSGGSFDHHYRSSDRIFGIALGIDNMTFGDQQNRKSVALEAVIGGLANEKREDFNLAAVVGIQRFYEPASNGYGVMLRGSYVFPQTETIISVPLRMIRIGVPGAEKIWRPTFGLRMDQGFTSFATVYLQVMKDYAAMRSGKVESGVSVGAGIQLAAPSCRIPLVNRSGCD